MGDEAHRIIENGQRALAEGYECGIDPEDPEREREEYIDRRIEEWTEAHADDPTGKQGLHRYWMLEGYDAGMEWAQSWCTENHDTPIHDDFVEHAPSARAIVGLGQSRYATAYNDGLRAGSRDACDHFMADWAKMRSSI